MTLPNVTTADTGEERKLVGTSTGAPLTISQYVLNSLRGRILSGHHLPGSRLDQKVVAQELGVSPIPVREGLRQLAAEGFVRISPHRGAFVVDLSLSDLKEIYMIREVLEELVTSIAVPRLTTQMLKHLAITLEKMEQATEEQDYGLILDLNRTFHFTIYQASGLPILLQTVSAFWDRSLRYRQLYTHLPGRSPQALAEHKEINAACQIGDAAVAARAVRNNVRQTCAGILAMLDPHPAS